MKNKNQNLKFSKSQKIYKCSKFKNLKILKIFKISKFWKKKRTNNGKKKNEVDRKNIFRWDFNLQIFWGLLQVLNFVFWFFNFLIFSTQILPIFVTHFRHAQQRRIRTHTHTRTNKQVSTPSPYIILIFSKCNIDSALKNCDFALSWPSVPLLRIKHLTIIAYHKFRTYQPTLPKKIFKPKMVHNRLNLQNRIHWQNIFLILVETLAMTSLKWDWQVPGNITV